jgi:hypothetical protein
MSRLALLAMPIKKTAYASPAPKATLAFKDRRARKALLAKTAPLLCA